MGIENPFPTMVLLRGLSREHGHWLPFLAHLANLEPKPQIVITPDFPGAGDFHNRRAAASVRRTVDFLDAQTRAQIEASPRPRVLIGQSMGGMVAFEWYTSSELFDAVILINSSCASLSPFYKRLTTSAARMFLKVAVSRNIETSERMILKLVSSNHAQDLGILKQWIHIQAQRPVSKQAMLRQLLAAGRYRPNLAPTKNNGLFLCSQGDDLVSMQCSVKWAERVGWPVAIHETAGHDLALDDPLWVLKHLASFRDLVSAEAVPEDKPQQQSSLNNQECHSKAG